MIGLLCCLLVTSEPNRPPVWPALPDVDLAERESWSLELKPTDPDGDRLRITADGLPPGATLRQGRLSFRPDSIQGGHVWPITVRASDGLNVAAATFRLRVSDSIAPPHPVSAESVTEELWIRHTVRQTTDHWLDSPGRAGRVPRVPDL